MCQQKSARKGLEPIPATTGELNSASEVATSFLISKIKLPSMLVFKKKAAFFGPQ